MNSNRETVGSSFGYEIVAFALTTYFILREGWTANELVWSLWLTSIGFGFVIILVWLISNVRRGQTKAFGVALFFIFHFGFFHLVHAAFIRNFLPPDGITNAATEQGLIDLDLIQLVIQNYWFLLAMTFVARWREIASAWDPPKLKDVLSYATVLRMHIMIFALGFCTMLGQIPFIALVIVLVFHFFPLSAFRNFLKNRIL